MTDMLADDFYGTDRRRVVNADLDREAVIESFRAAADLGLPGATSIVIATRGERLVLIRVRYSLSDQDPDAFHVDLLFVIEVDADERIATFVALTSTKSRPPLRNSTPVTRQARGPHTRIYGPSSHGPAQRSSGTSYLRRHRIG